MKSTAKRYLIQALAGILIGGVLLWLVFRGTHWEKVLESIRGASVPWLIGTQFCFLTIFFTRALRWGCIVRTTGQASFRALFSATQIAYLVNHTVSGRLGELVRPFVLSRLAPLRFMTAFATVVADRVTDVIAMLSFLLLALIAFNPEGDILIPAATFGTDDALVFHTSLFRQVTYLSALFLAAVLIGLVLVFRYGALLAHLAGVAIAPISQTLAARSSQFIGHFARGLEVLRRPADAAKALLYTVVTWGLLALGSVCNLEAFHVDYPWFMPFLMTAFIAVFTSIPGPPGRLGQFHLPLVVCLVMVIPNIDVDHAKAFAIVAHLLGLLPVIVVGVYCLAREQFNLFAVVRDSVAAGEREEDARGSS